MSDTPTQPKTVHPAYRTSTYVLAGILTVILLTGAGAYSLWNLTEREGYLALRVPFGTNGPTMFMTDVLPDLDAKPVKAKKKVAATEPAPTDFAPPVPPHKPTPPPAQVQPQ